MWIAQEATPSPIEFINFGVLGLVVVAFIIGWIWPKPSVDRLLRDKDRLLDQQAKQLTDLSSEVKQLHDEVRGLRGWRSESSWDP